MNASNGEVRYHIAKALRAWPRAKALVELQAAIDSGEAFLGRRMQERCCLK